MENALQAAARFPAQGDALWTTNPRHPSKKLRVASKTPADSDFALRIYSVLLDVTNKPATLHNELHFQQGIGNISCGSLSFEDKAEAQ